MRFRQSPFMVGALAASIFAQPVIARETEDVPAQDALQTGRFADGSKFLFDHMVSYWNDGVEESAPTELTDDTALGFIDEMKVVLQKKTIPKKEAALFERKLRLIAQEVLSQPSLRNIRGASLHPSIWIDQNRHGIMQGTFSVYAVPIRLNLSQTKNVNGRYWTPGTEGPMLEISLNSNLVYMTQSVREKGIYNNNPIAEIHETPFPYVANSDRRPIATLCCDHSGESYQEWDNDGFYNWTLPATKVQFLFGKVAHAAYHQGLRDGTHPPTSHLGRLFAALYMVNWPDVVRRIEEVR
ncbi:hypothetical protein IC614_07440 [Allosphingosinicella flava]|uniref:Uncharacterized protein n=1 Tax=Allosphingosinicella flava TaxID=2771430 RepID=A0A7T2GHZ4_9SPHN|nr:hypothetical protein [Sphingosinicella flava]QPQ54199.1 hypothetical protein IC614_07440 [Sphingosinicella flava]